jgi:hypothetical protein
LVLRKKRSTKYLKKKKENTSYAGDDLPVRVSCLVSAGDGCSLNDQVYAQVQKPAQ